MTHLDIFPKVVAPGRNTEGEFPRFFPTVGVVQERFWHLLAKTGYQPSYSEHLLCRDPDLRRFIYHGLSNYNLGIMASPKLKKMGRVLTVHDLIPQLQGSGVSRGQRMKFSYFLPKALKNASHVLVVSKWTQDQLEDKYPWVASKTVLIRNGISGFCAELKPKQDMGIPRALYVARGEVYKRTEWFCEILRQSGEQLMGTLVTDVTTRNRLSGLFQDLLNKGTLEIQCELSEEKICSLFRRSQVYLHPSLFEGFNIPASNALCYGLPIVCCSGSGTSELLNDKVAIELAPDASIQDWLYAVRHQIRKSNSPEWYTMVRGHHNSLDSWKNCALAVKSIYEQAI